MVNNRAIPIGTRIPTSGIYECPHCTTRRVFKEDWIAVRCNYCFTDYPRGWVLFETLPKGYAFPKRGFFELLASFILNLKFKMRGAQEIKTTVSPTGIVSSFNQSYSGNFRVISTLFHPNGCYQTAVFPDLFSQVILGYKLTSDQISAIQCHVESLLAICHSDPTSWEEWTPTMEEARSVIDDVSFPASDLENPLGLDEAVYRRYQFQIWDEDILNNLLSNNNLPSINKHK